jgi:hypothetical protein
MLFVQCLCGGFKFDLPIFQNLASLEFCVFSCMCDVLVLPTFLEGAPNLEVLILHKVR